METPCPEILDQVHETVRQKADLGNLGNKDVTQSWHFVRCSKSDPGARRFSVKWVPALHPPSRPHGTHYYFICQFTRMPTTT